MPDDDDIIDTVAARLGMVTPVEPHMALSPAFVRACLAEQRARLAPGSMPVAEGVHPQEDG